MLRLLHLLLLVTYVTLVTSGCVCYFWLQLVTFRRAVGGLAALGRKHKAPRTNSAPSQLIAHHTKRIERPESTENRRKGGRFSDFKVVLNANKIEVWPIRKALFRV